MKKILFIIAAAAMCSCARNVIIPKATNTVGTASFADLRLARSNYEVLRTVTAEAAVSYSSNNNGTVIDINGVDEDFSLHYTYKAQKGLFSTKKGSHSGVQCVHSGVLKLGYLSNDYTPYSPDTVYSPEDIARRLAIYRAINQVRQEGADGLIEPTISTNIEQRGKIIIFKSVVTAKMIKLKTDN